ncbi:GNAT family N-acetyltransferase [Marivita sp. GX14005]|uniref:GNAT family N-acetyltransferase n=1 Tax=Marivita sp. GX14005 TaxID=2942276 RepID=UPI002018577D|nr:GNAT family N-acetyltransferase [Marivita sp. GX14005]MCL3882077.1 GNAT family N-acetyltransferase [Marivita sp. GX14005]
MTLLRPASPLDAGRVGTILSDWIDATHWVPRVRSRAEEIAGAGAMIDRGWVIVAETGEDVMGFIAQGDGTVHALYIDTAARGQGLGARLLQRCMKERSGLQLWSFVENSGARRFYRRLGFREFERGDGAGNDEGLPDIRLEWQRETT